MKTSRITCLAIATLLTGGSFARAESLVHIDELAVAAERQARQVFYQTYRLHAHGPAAQELRSGAIQMVRLARHIHDLAHVDQFASHSRHRSHGVRFDRQAHINRDVADLDRLMHEMQDLVIRMKVRTARRPSFDRHVPGNVGVSFGRHASISFNTCGPSRYHGGHSLTDPALDRLEFSLAKLSETVHHLLDDTDVVCIRQR